MWRQLRARHPGFREAVRADAEMTALHRGERHHFRSRGDLVVQVLRLCWVSDVFLCPGLYRLKARMQARGIRSARIAHKLTMMLSQITIGDPVIMHPGVYIIHGQIVIDGIVEIGPGAVIGPWTSIGLQAGNVHGPTIGNDVHIGSGTRSWARCASARMRRSARTRLSSRTWRLERRS